MFHILTPPFVLEAYAANQLQENSTAVCLFVDTAGFTPLTSALMTHGTEGAEVLAQVLADIFTPLLTIVYEQGGYVAGFAGDAFKAIFPGLSAASHQRAITAAWQIRQQLLAQPIQSTRFGDFRFAVKVTVASGSVEWRILRAAANAAAMPQQAALFFGGAALTQALAADPLVRAGEIVLTAAVAEQLPTPSATLTPVAGHFRLDDWPISTTPPAPLAHPTPSAPHPSPPTHHHSPLAHHFFPTELLERQTQGEFRQVVTMFVNLQTLPSGATATNLVTALFQLLNQYGGYLCRIGQIGERDPGGTLLLFWGAPTSRENDVARALHFALGVQTVAPMPVRIGITTALVYAGFVGSPLREEYTCYGAHVNLAARHMVMAGWGEIWLDPTTAQLAGSTFSVIEHGQLRFKGFAEERTVYRLLSQQLTKTEPFYQGTLIGRAAELAQLQKALTPLAAGQCAGLITISGEAGVGKSRLVYELQRLLEGRQGDGETGRQGDTSRTPQWFLCQTDEILRQPLNPFRYWLRNYFNQSANEDEATNKGAFTAKLADLLASLAPHAAETPEQSKIANRSTEAHERLKSEITRTRSFLGALVDLYWPDSLYAQVEPQLRFENTLAALKTLILAESLRQPVILHLEDAHWLDADSQTLLTRLLHNVADYPLAVIVTRRPEGETGRQEDKERGRQGDKETRGGGEGDETTQRLAVEGPQVLIQLMTLTPDEIRALAAAQLQGAPAPALVTLIEERAEGNPFFAEQLLHYLREQDWLVQGADGWQLRPELAPTTILPNGARALLIARLDQLPQPVKEVVQTAAVLGREFDTNVLAQMLADDQSLAAKLAVADRAAIWYAMTQARYLFRHALLREAAYDMQLRARLRALHHLAGAALEQVYGADLTPYFGELAYHYDQAEAAEQAVRWYGQAGEQAARSYANHDAVRYFSQALKLTPTVRAETRFKLVLGREAVYEVLGKVDAQRHDIAVLEAIAEQLTDVTHQAQAALRSAEHFRMTGDYRSALLTTQRAAELASQTNNLQLRGSIQQHWGRIYWEQGDYGTGKYHLEQALALAQASSHLRGQAKSLTDLGTIYFEQSEYALAEKQYTAALALYQTLKERRGEMGALAMLGAIANETANYETALAYYQRAQTICHSIGYAYGEAFVLGNLGMNYISVGQYEMAKRHLLQALENCRERKDQHDEALYLDSLAVIYLQQNKIVSALSHSEQALAIQQAIGTQRFAAYSLTYQGEALWRLGNLSAAYLAYAQALTIRRQLGEEKLIPGILAGLAQVALAQGQMASAQAQLATVLAWLEAHGIEGIEFPIQLYLSCYQMLLTLGDPERAQGVLATGYHLLQSRAEKIQDLYLRQSFLEAVPFNRELALIWQNRLAASSA